MQTSMKIEVDTLPTTTTAAADDTKWKQISPYCVPSLYSRQTVTVKIVPRWAHTIANSMWQKTVGTCKDAFLLLLSSISSVGHGPIKRVINCTHNMEREWISGNALQLPWPSSIRCCRHPISYRVKTLPATEKLACKHSNEVNTCHGNPIEMANGIHLQIT